MYHIIDMNCKYKLNIFFGEFEKNYLKHFNQDDNFIKNFTVYIRNL